jgi:hypothetical protein
MEQTKQAIFTFNSVNVLIKCVAQVKNNDGIFETLRYVKGEKSLHPEEQSEKAKPTRIHVQGYRYITTDANLIEFLKKHPNFTKKPDNVTTHFYIENKEVEIQDKIASEELILDAKFIIRNALGRDLRASAYLLIREEAFTLPEKEIKAKLYEIAGKKPQQIIDSFKDEISKYKIFIAKALNDKVIEIPVGSTAINWYNGGEIFSVEKGQNVFDEFSKYISTNEKAGLQQEIMLIMKAKNPDLANGDDFTVLKGVGEAVAEKLYKLGITTFTQLSEQTDENIKSLAEEKEIKLSNMIVFTDIIKEAKTKI